MSDGLFEMTEPDWVTVPVTELATSQYRGQIIDVDGIVFAFTGTHRGSDADGQYIVIHGRDAEGVSVEATLRPGEMLLVKAKEAIA